MVITSLISRTKAIIMLKSASWGPTQQTAKVLHHSYIESRIRYGMTAWFPYLADNLKKKLGVYLRRAIRAVMGLPTNCWNVALMAEADLDSIEDIAMKSAVGLYCMINPTDTTQMTLAKRHFLARKPLWLSMLRDLPEEILDGPIQVSLDKKELFAINNLTVNKKSLNTQAETVEAESECNKILYTDASVDLTSNPPGEAVIGYLWYERNSEGEWEIITQKNTSIGHGHSSYSAEAIAISLGLADYQPSSPSNTTHDLDIHTPEENSGSNNIISDKVNIKYDIGIFTDSLSNIETINKSIAETKDQQLLLKSLSMINDKMIIHHVRGHRDIIRNNEADRICNVKSQREDRTIQPGSDGKKTKAKVKSWTKAWASKNRYEQIQNDKQAKKRKSETRNWMLKQGPRPKFYNNMPRRKGVILAKARTYRMTTCNWFLHWIKAKGVESPECKTCKTKDTIRHAIDNCQMHENGREKMLRKIGHLGKVSDLLSSTNIKEANEVADFLVKGEDERLAIRKQ